MKIFSLIQVRNEERYLPGFLHHIAPYVDGIVALDDCSVDSTVDILRREPKVLSVLHERHAGPAHSNEVSNRHRLLMEAARLGADWVLCADADERFEEDFLRRVHGEARKGEWLRQPVRLVEFVNLWNRPDQYRLDGLCGPRFTPRMFRLPTNISRREPRMHQPWVPPEWDGVRGVRMRAHLYHLRMIDRADREMRFRKFSTVDPEAREQAIGYLHLIDETGLELRPVDPRRGYTDLPSASAPAARSPARVLAGCLADAVFARRFHLDPGIILEPHSTGLAPPPSLDGRPAMPPRDWSRLYGFDFESIFTELRAKRHGTLSDFDEKA